MSRREAIVAKALRLPTPGGNQSGCPTNWRDSDEPVRSFFQELLSLANEAGTKSVILRSRERVAEVKFPEGEIDIDTREDWEELNPGPTSAETMPKGRRRRKVN